MDLLDKKELKYKSMLGVGYQNPVGGAYIKSRVTALCHLGPMKKYDEFYGLFSGTAS